MDKWKCTICGYVYDPVTGDPDNGEELVVNTLSVTTGVDVEVTSWTITMPEGS